MPPSYIGPVVYGLTLPCRGAHNYCLDCLRSYIDSKVEASDETGGSSLSIRCPECTWDDDWRIDDRTVTKRYVNMVRLETLSRLPGMKGKGQTGSSHRGTLLHGGTGKRDERVKLRYSGE